MTVPLCVCTHACPVRVSRCRLSSQVCCGARSCPLASRAAWVCSAPRGHQPQPLRPWGSICWTSFSGGSERAGRSPPLAVLHTCSVDTGLPGSQRLPAEAPGQVHPWCLATPPHPSSLASQALASEGVHSPRAHQRGLQEKLQEVSCPPPSHPHSSPWTLGARLGVTATPCHHSPSAQDQVQVCLA